MNAKDRYGVTPLRLACINASAPMVRLLLESGADPESSFGQGETALMTAARTGNPEVVQLLLARGAKASAQEQWRGQTALMWAAAEGHTEAVRLLLAAGADRDARSKAGFSALLFAIREGRIGSVKALLDAGADVNQTLPVAPRPGRPDPNPPKSGASALDLAVSNAHFELAALLLDRGADPNHDGPGWTPLHTLTWTRQPGYGSNDPAPPGSGSLDSLALVRRFAAKGANLNARMTRRSNAGLSAMNMIGATPLLMAARTADAPLMRLLAELGADTKVTNADGSTLLMIAAGLGTRSPGEDAGAEEEVLEAVKVALELGNDINAVDKNGETALHGAAYKHLPRVVEFLALHRDAKPDVWNQKNKSGWTPLRIAVGVHRTGNYRPSPETAEAMRQAMRKLGLPTVVDPEPGYPEPGETVALANSN